MTETNETPSKMMTVKTGYARVALMLMAANLLLTGYAIASLANIQTASTPSRTEASQLHPAAVATPTVASPESEETN